jgi:C-terminal processing protease CtpA/Prc
MKKIIVAIGISLAVGFAAAAWMEPTFWSPISPKIEQSTPDVSSFDAAAPAEERIRALEQAVIQEQQARQVLEDEMLMLREEIEERRADPVEAEEQSVAAREARREAFMSRRFSNGPTQGQLDRLVEAGFAPDQAAWIVQREAEVQMEMLQARYEAMRAQDNPRFFGSTIDTELRAELGEVAYERYLAANGRPTAIRIGNVIPNSPAQAAGLQPGDQIVRYDGERVFSMMDVAGHIMQNEAEGNVVVDIERGGVAMQLVIPRGPLGVMGN